MMDADQDRLILDNDKLALRIAHGLRESCPLPFEDLCQVARIGLIKAARRFDPGKGHRFSTFAVPWIRGEISHYLRAYSPDLVKISQGDRKWRQKVRARQKQLAKYGRAISECQVAIAYGLTEQQWAGIVERTTRVALIDFDSLFSIFDESSNDDRADIHAAINQLPEDQRQAVVLAYFRNQRLSPQQRQSLDAAHDALRQTLAHA